MHKIRKNMMKINFNTDTHQQHSYSTRNVHVPRLIQCRTTLGQKNIFRSCTEQYRTLPQSITQQRTIHSFKRALKNALLNETN